MPAFLKRATAPTQYLGGQFGSYFDGKMPPNGEKLKRILMQRS
jgi:hypothetical protein